MRQKELLTLEKLRESLRYDAETGIFTWVKPKANRLKPGDVAGTVRKSTGYVVISIGYRLYMAHRLAWFYVHGTWPDKFIDHIDMNKTNNSLKNLRAATKSQNQANTLVRRDSKSGVKCVRFDRKRNKYKALILGKQIGRFNTVEEATAAYAKAAADMFGEYHRP